MNIIFRIVIIGAFYCGIKAVYNFYRLMDGYQSLQGEAFFNRVAFFLDDYMFMMLFMVVAIVLSIITRKQISSRAYMARTISMVVAFITGCMSFPAIGIYAYIAIAKYPQMLQMVSTLMQSFTLSEVYASPLTDFLIAKPYLFYMFFISTAIYTVLVGTTIYTWIKSNKSRNTMVS